MSDEEILNIPVEEFIPFVHQSRERFAEDEVLNLAEDIKAHGQLQPGVAWHDPGRGKYVLICGERRWRAIQLAALRFMAVKVIKGNLTPGQMLAINLSENLQRASLNVLERAKAFRRLAQLEDLTNQQLAERLHISDSTVSRDLAILNLPEELQLLIVNGRLPVSLGCLLSRIDDPVTQMELAEAVGAGRMNRQQLASAVHDRTGKKKSGSKTSRFACRLDGGLSLTLSAEKPLTRQAIQAVIDRLRQEAKTLPENDSAISASPETVKK